jgi:23S rRNA (adenine2503-C2)-methyltransferase
MLAHVNLIPVNYVMERGFEPSSPESIRRFYDTLKSKGINVTVRRTLGSDINAACGQLRHKTEAGK